MSPFRLPPPFYCRRTYSRYTPLGGSVIMIGTYRTQPVYSMKTCSTRNNRRIIYTGYGQPQQTRNTPFVCRVVTFELSNSEKHDATCPSLQHVTITYYKAPTRNNHTAHYTAQMLKPLTGMMAASGRVLI